MSILCVVFFLTDFLSSLCLLERCREKCNWIWWHPCSPTYNVAVVPCNPAVHQHAPVY